MEKEISIYNTSKMMMKFTLTQEMLLNICIFSDMHLENKGTKVATKKSKADKTNNSKGKKPVSKKYNMNETKTRTSNLRQTHTKYC